ncbi:hypothetical protein BLNAU_3340 [Blattamonas nauphoetae]|uniref:Uncharacterized protein n=1 Tax=Blattamonas nauphoetae TaxID=2049346 RepID=A0ABQ9YCP5_9EUKA|nr:hypothetical protein BLNAU_3340 [Blattamonas nauphoetae]
MILFSIVFVTRLFSHPLSITSNTIPIADEDDSETPPPRESVHTPLASPAATHLKDIRYPPSVTGVDVQTSSSPFSHRAIPRSDSYYPYSNTRYTYPQPSYSAPTQRVNSPNIFVQQPQYGYNQFPSTVPLQQSRYSPYSQSNRYTPTTIDHLDRFTYLDDPYRTPNPSSRPLPPNIVIMN